MSFTLPKLNLTPTSWGPPTSIDISALTELQKLPFESAAKGEKIGRVSDFTFQAQRYRELQDRKSGRVAVEDEDDAFHSVEISKRRGGAAVRTRTTVVTTRAEPAAKDTSRPQQQQAKQSKAAATARAANAARSQMIRADMNMVRGKALRDIAVQFKATWTSISEVPITQLTEDKVNAAEITSEEVGFAGELYQYSGVPNKAQPRAVVPLPHPADTYQRAAVETIEPVAIELVTEKVKDATVVISDTLLATIMAAPKSFFAWDVEATVEDGQVIFDRRSTQQTTPVDISAVWESAGEPIVSENPHNTYVKLGVEAAAVELALGELSIKKDAVLKKGDLPNSFAEKAAEYKQTAPGAAYVYKKFTIPGNNAYDESELEAKPITVLVRCAVNAGQVRGDKTEYVNVHAFTEFEPRPALSYKSALEKQMGGVYASELRMNSVKVYKWAAKSYLSGAEQVVFAYVSRANSKDNSKHVVVAAQNERAVQLQRLADFKPAEAWGAFRAVTDHLRRQEPGQYAVAFEPLRQALRIGRIPSTDNTQNE